MIYSKNNEELTNKFNAALQNNLANKYPKFISYLNTLYNRKEQWALCFRKGLLTRGKKKNNISEAGMKIIKDVILERTKAYSPVQLLFFIVYELEVFYEIKVFDIAANRPPQYLKNTNLIFLNLKRIFWSTNK